MAPRKSPHLRTASNSPGTHQFELTPKKARPARTIAEVRELVRAADPPSVLATTEPPKKKHIPFQTCTRCGWTVSENAGMVFCDNVGCGHIQ
jgi:hypothetical protein